MLWIHICIRGHKPLLIGSFHRPPKTDILNLHQLNDSLDRIKQKYKTAVIVLGGDLNLPDIDWPSSSVKPGACDSAKCSLLLKICNDHDLEQQVRSPTRISGPTRNILDVTLTSHPSLITHCSVKAGISDHEAVSLGMNLEAKINKKKPRKVYLFSKGDHSNFNLDMAAFSQQFFCGDPLTRSVEENWDLLKTNILNTMDKHIPSKYTSSRHNFDQEKTTALQPSES